MTRLSLKDACLLDVSGELSTKRKAALREHVEKFPAATIEYQLVKGQFELLRSLPKAELNDFQKRGIASSIKQGIHKKLAKIEREKAAQNRMKLVYRALAGISGIAACIVIGVGIYTIDENIRAERQAAQIAQMNNTVEKIATIYAESTTNETDAAIQAVNRTLANLEAGATVTGTQDDAMKNLLDALASIEEKPAAPRNDNGSL